MNPLLSIVIATKNRQKYAVHVARSILSLEDTRIQVVIQDNSDTDDLGSKLTKYQSDSRFIYRYTPPPFSAIDNFNASLELATGEYVCLIGDDDGINPEIINATGWAMDNNIDSLTGNLAANYRWEGTGAPNTFFTKMTGSTLTIQSFSGRAYEVNVEQSLISLMRNGATNYLEFKLPKLYHGIIRRECLEYIKGLTGYYLGGLSPDIYSAVMLSSVINRHIYIDYPLTIPGVCAESGSIKEGQIKKHSKRLEDAPHFNSRKNYRWAKDVPRIYCVQTIWADSAFAALTDLHRVDLIKKFNRVRLYANILVADSTVKELVFNHMKNVRNGISILLIVDYFLLAFELIMGPLKRFLVKRVWGRLMIILRVNRLISLYHLHDINTAMLALVSHLRKLEINWMQELSKTK